MDVFFEQLVRKKSTGADVLKRIGLLIATVLVCLIVILVLPAFSAFFGLIWPMLTAGVLYGSWYLMTQMDVEYEYILTNGEIDVDKIVHQRRRKRMVTVNVRSFTEMGLYKPQEHALKGRNFASRVEAARDMTADDCYYAVLDHAQYGKMLLLFSPNERILSGCKEYLKRGVWNG